MVIDCKNITRDILKSAEALYARGSFIYGTNRSDSDHDILIIVSDDCEFINDLDCVINEKADTRIHSFYVNFNDGNGDIDGQIIKESDFIDMIHEHTPLALEAIFSDPTIMSNKYKDEFHLDKWKLRQIFGGVSNNSWAKAKKKMTVVKDMDLTCGVKSLFHSIRLLVFACQIAEHGEIIDFEACSELWKTIYDEYCNKLKYEHYNTVWEYFKNTYKPVWNTWHSKLVELCPRPEEFYHKK